LCNVTYGKLYNDSEYTLHIVM